MGKILLVALLLLFCVVSSYAQNEIDVKWKWQQSDTGAVTGYLPYVCFGTCDETGPWLDENDASQNRVVFPASDCDPVPAICEYIYQGNWAVGETFSFRLTAFTGMLGGASFSESIPSNILVVTRTTTPPSTVPPTTLPPQVMPPQLFDIELTP